MGSNGGGKLTPNLDLEGTKVHNLTVLQRSDPFIEEILFTAAHVTLYDFNIDLTQWSRKDVEGSLFVVKRNAQPRFQFVVMNRRNAANLVENLLGDFEYEVQVPYLLYRNLCQEVIGIWFYNSQECQAIANLFSRILSAFAKVSAKPKDSLNRSDFEEFEAVPGDVATGRPLDNFASSNTTISIPDISSHAQKNGTVSNAKAPVQQKNDRQQQLLASGTRTMQGQTPIATQIPTLHGTPPHTTSTSTVPILNMLDSSTNINDNHTSLVKPSLFVPPTATTPLVMIPVQSSSVTAGAAIQQSLTLQPAMSSLRPFSPPVTPALNSIPNHGPAISRDKVRDAMLRLVQNDQFVDLVYREILNAHQP